MSVSQKIQERVHSPRDVLTAFRSRAYLIRLITVVLIIILLTPSITSAITYDASAQPALEKGTITKPANGSTVISAQGYTFRGNTNEKKPARLVAVDERGDLKWTHTDNVGGSAWFYDVDPLPNGNLLVSSPRAGETVVFEFNRTTKTRVWQKRFEMEDTHDIDYLGENRFVIANMREWNESADASDDRVVIYNRSTDAITWQWKFRNHFSAETDGGYSKDWTHVNDVDPIGEDRLLLSPRNFDQVIVVDIETKQIVERLGRDGAHEILQEQHNPDWLMSDTGTPTILVADSENDRVVEYAKLDNEWTRTWTVGTNTLTWPRDADRLPNGNTLIVDTLNHRVIEVTPMGEVVWEYYATWGPYDAERVVHGDESNGPTMRDINASGNYPITGSANLTTVSNNGVGVADWARTTSAGTPLAEPASAIATQWAHVTPWIRPVWMTGWDLLFALGSLIIVMMWLIGEVITARQRLLATFRDLWNNMGI